MTDIMLNTREAARYVKLPEPFFRHQVKHGTGPAYTAPSARSRFFSRRDLDAWMRTWSYRPSTPPSQ